MMHTVQVLIAALGRICLSIIFILAGINKIFDWQRMELSLMNALSDMMSFIPHEGIKAGIQVLLPWVPILLLVACFFEILGGLLLLIGYKVRLGAFLLILFLIPTTLVFHSFWFLQGEEKELQMIMFLKNLSIFGGLLITLAFGTGRSKSSSHQGSSGET